MRRDDADEDDDDDDDEEGDDGASDDDVEFEVSFEDDGGDDCTILSHGQVMR